MKIIMVGYGHGGSYHYTDDNIGSGWENLCTVLDGYWYELNDAWGMEADVVLYIGTMKSVHALAGMGGKPRTWGKVVMLQEAGGSMVNNYLYALDIHACRFDAFLVYTIPLIPQFETFGKPVIPILNAYPFHKYPHLRDVPKSRDTIALYLQRYTDPSANVLGTFAIMRALPHAIRAVCWVDLHEREGLCALVEGAGLWSRIDVYPTVHWPDYLETLARCGVVVSMDGRQTWGRVDLDAALVGIRCVGPYTAAKAVLWPELEVHPHDIGRAVILTMAELDSPVRTKPAALTGDSFDHAAVIALLRYRLRQLWPSLPV